MISLEGFANYIKEHITEALPEDIKGTARPELHKVTKSGDREMIGLTLGINDGSGRPQISPCVYLEPFYNDYKDGVPMGLILEDVAKAERKSRLSAKPAISQIPEQFQDFESASEKLYVQMCGIAENRQFLSGRPHTDFGGLAATYRLLVADYGNGTASIPVTNSVAEYWGASTEEIHAAAIKNAREPALFTMKDILKEIMTNGAYSAGNILGMDPEDIDTAGNPMYVLSNADRSLGASTVTDTHALEAASAIVGGDMYILPSSIHEVILLPISAGFPLEELKKIVRDTNESGTIHPDEILSGDVQVYDSASKQIKSTSLEKLPDKQAGRGAQEMKGPRI